MRAAGLSRAFDMDPFEEPEIWRNMLESLLVGLCVLNLQKRIIVEYIVKNVEDREGGNSDDKSPAIKNGSRGAET